MREVLLPPAVVAPVQHRVPGVPVAVSKKQVSWRADEAARAGDDLPRLLPSRNSKAWPLLRPRCMFGDAGGVAETAAGESGRRQQVRCTPRRRFLQVAGPPRITTRRALSFRADRWNQLVRPVGRGTVQPSKRCVPLGRPRCHEPLRRDQCGCGPRRCGNGDLGYSPISSQPERGPSIGSLGPRIGNGASRRTGG